MSKQKVFELIGTDKMKQEIRSGLRGESDTTYHAVAVKIGQDNVSEWDGKQQTYVKISEKGGWLGDYDRIKFENDSLVSYIWKTLHMDSSTAYQARFELLFSFSTIMSLASIPYIPQSSAYFYPAPKGTFDVSGNHPWAVWSNNRVTYELHFFRESILLKMYQGPPRDRDGM